MIYAFNKKVRRLEGIKLLVILELLDCCISLAIYIPTPIYSSAVLCNIQGILLEFFAVCEILWTGFISAQLYWGLLKKNNNYFSLAKASLCICIFSIVSALIPLIFRSYTNVGVWCFFNQSYGNNYLRDLLFRFLLFYAVLWGTFIWNIILYIKSIKIIRGNTRKKITNVFSILKYYPFGIIFCYLPITILRVLQSCDYSIPHNFLEFTFFPSRLVGFVNAIIYGFTYKIRKILFKKQIIFKDQSLTKFNRQ